MRVIPLVSIALLLACLALAVPQASAAPQVRVEAVVAALRAHNNQKALELSTELTRAQPDDPRAWTLRGIALARLGRSSESLTSLRQALDLDPNYPAALEEAAQLEYQTNAPGAEKLLERLVALEPANITAQAMLGALAFKRRDCTAAISHFQRAGDAVSGSRGALREFGVCLMRVDRAQEAIPVFHRLLDLEAGNWHARYNLGLVQFRAGHDREALETLLPLTRGSAANPEALNLIAAVYEAQAKTPQAVAALRQAIALAPREITNYLDLGTLCLDHGSFQTGVDVINWALKLFPDSAPLLIERGVLYVRMGRFKEADADFGRASRLAPSQSTSTVALGISLLQENDPSKSLAVVKQRLHKDPDDPVLNYLLAEILLREGCTPGTARFQTAVHAARRASALRPGFALAWNVLTELDLRAGQTSQAEQAAQKALKADPSNAEAIYHLIVCMRRSGQQKAIPPLVEKLARATAAAQQQNAAQSRFKLVEEPQGH